jgi:hypothetical protein
MLSLDHHAHPLWSEVVSEPIGYFGGQALLDLKSARAVFDDPAELRETDDPVSWQVRDVGDAVERQQVVLAERVEGDPAGHDQLVIPLVGEGRRRERGGAEELGE